MFCQHHEEDALFGGDNVPCPLCGHGMTDSTSAASDPLRLVDHTDSHEALVAVWGLTSGGEELGADVEADGAADADEPGRVVAPTHGFVRAW